MVLAVGGLGRADALAGREELLAQVELDRRRRHAAARAQLGERELRAGPAAGLLGARFALGGPRDFAVVQHWRSTEELFAYASAPGREHRPVWAAFNRQVRKSRGSVGIWHETYRVPSDGFECVYVDMPPYGLAAAYGTAPVATRGNSAPERLRSASRRAS
ncbi:monooxygenase family protein [Streptomyces sp. NPDC048172]|uniref:monooxygenase family protein n=1 Tax=Streptomyces sp. NPDC048172 TaxID=3365505 RepID=UPI00371E04BD